MVEGIDISRLQTGIDLNAAKREGIEFVFVKASGGNTGSLYRADGYSQNIGAVRTAGLKAGHYHVSGGASGSDAGRYFAQNLIGYQSGDALILDNEVLDDGRLYGDAEAADFMNAVKSVIPNANLFLYLSASDLRSRDWSRTTSLAKVWVASYSNDDGNRHDVDTGGKPWAIHQYSSNRLVAGRRVDANYSPLSINELFGGVSPMGYNPFAGYRITGTWADHMSYSLGGEDYPLGFGTPLPAAAAGTLRTSGGSGELAAGQIGSAGRRSILMLDRPIGDVVGVVYQHQSRFGENGRHYNQGEILGWSGASANGSDYGGDIHLHIHCVTAGGQRRQFTKYFGATSNTYGITSFEDGIEDDMFSDQDRADVRSFRDGLERLIRAVEANLGGKADNQKDQIVRAVQQEGTQLKVLMNRASGIYALASVANKYFFELGADINADTPENTRAARKLFAENTLALYRARGFAQDFVHELSEEEYNFNRMICTNTPVNVEDARIAKIEETVSTLSDSIKAIADKLGI
ncbi:peptidase domain protein [Rathayibacter phage NCPPB3778]|nr:peptidase domain protein [Rathayibacter phage NCPPB3778]